MGRSEISREVEYTSSTQSGVCDFRTKEGLSIKLTIPMVDLELSYGTASLMTNSLILGCIHIRVRCLHG